MAKKAIGVHIDPLVVEFFSQLSYLRGYKAALYDTKIRFQNSDKEMSKRWRFELNAATKLVSEVAGMMQSDPELSLHEMESYLMNILNNKQNYASMSLEEFEAYRYVVERALGMLSELRRTSSVAEVQAA